MSVNYLSASKQPLKDLSKVTYEGQPETRKMYRSGYESFMNDIPVIGKDSSKAVTELMSSLATTTLKQLGIRLFNELWPTENMPPENEFYRTILAMESPKVNANGSLDEGSEIVLAQWGKGFTSPVHGHKDGLIYEQLLHGKLMVNLYRIIDAEKRIVRPLRSDIFEGNSVIAAGVVEGNGTARSALVHSFVTIDPSTSLHYVPEHTRDGRDNTYTVQSFDDRYPLTPLDVDRITVQQSMYLRKGDVVLVDSSNVPEYGYHYIVVTGHPIVKPHGLRIQDVAIHAPTNKLLPSYQQEMGVTALKLKPDVAKTFLDFHGIKIENDEVIFPNA